MTRQIQPPRSESSLLAAGLAVTGTLYFSDKLSSLADGALKLQVVLQAAGILMIAAGICLLLQEWPIPTSGKHAGFDEPSKLNANGNPL